MKKIFIFYLLFNLSNISAQVTDSFEVFPLPNMTGTNSISVVDPFCLGSNGTVTFNASALANGVYDISYGLSGANVSTQTVSSVFVSSGTGLFTIPSSVLANAGTTSINLLSISNSTTSCKTFIMTGTITDSFVINGLPLVQGETYQEFCSSISPTINNLIVTYNSVNWYDSPNSATPLPSNTILLHGNIYYAEGINSTTGCVSEERLEISVGVINCAFLIPDGFSPNGDGVNELFNIVNGISYYPNYEFEVFDRYGSKLFKGKSWDGKYNGNLLPSGIYFIILHYNDGITKDTQHRIYLNK